MLVLSRKESQKVIIGGNIVVTINRISGNRITLGIEAPKDVRVVRGELESQDTVDLSECQGLSIEIADGSALEEESMSMPAPLADRMRNRSKMSAK
jgi:carbon storage regulator CsrA